MVKANGNLNSQVAMTYSMELFLCMVVGLVAGHAFFNSGHCHRFDQHHHKENMLQKLLSVRAWIPVALLRQSPTRVTRRER